MAKKKQTFDSSGSIDSREPGSGAETTLILLTGLAATLSGLALCAGPMLMPEMGAITQQFAEHGILGGTLMLGGLVLVVLGLLRRGQLSLEAEVWRGENDPVREQIAADVLETRDAITALEQGMGSLVRQVKEAQAAVHAVIHGDGSAKAMKQHIDGLASHLEQMLQRQAAGVQSQVVSLESNLSAALEGQLVSAVESLHDLWSAQQNVASDIEDAFSMLPEEAFQEPSATSGFDPFAGPHGVLDPDLHEEPRAASYAALEESIAQLEEPLAPPAAPEPAAAPPLALELAVLDEPRAEPERAPATPAPAPQPVQLQAQAPAEIPQAAPQAPQAPPPMPASPQAPAPDQAPLPQAQVPQPQAQVPQPQAQVPQPQAQVPQPQAQDPQPRAQAPIPQLQAQQPQPPQQQAPQPQHQAPAPASQAPTPGVPQAGMQAPTSPRAPLDAGDTEPLMIDLGDETPAPALPEAQVDPLASLGADEEADISDESLRTALRRLSQDAN